MVTPGDGAGQDAGWREWQGLLWGLKCAVAGSGCRRAVSGRAEMKSDVHLGRVQPRVYEVPVTSVTDFHELGA